MNILQNVFFVKVAKGEHIGTAMFTVADNTSTNLGKLSTTQMKCANSCVF